MKYLAVIFVLMCHSLAGQTISDFTYSSYLDKIDSSRVSLAPVDSSTISIKLSTYVPCNGNFQASAEQTDDALLDISIAPIPMQYRDSNDVKAEIIEVADCKCLFDFSFIVNGISSKDVAGILVNGQTLPQIDQANILDPALEIGVKN
ncbi:MAG: hypothetical protein RIE59_08695 [Imperialibacter sp.]